MNGGLFALTFPVTAPVTDGDDHRDRHGFDVTDVAARCQRDPAFYARLNAWLDGTKRAEPGTDGVPILGIREAYRASASAPVPGGARHDHTQLSHALSDLAVAALPPKGNAYSATFTAPNADHATFAAMLSLTLSDGIVSGEVLAYVIVPGRRGRDHVHGHGLLVTRSTNDLRRLRDGWARRVGASDPAKALCAKGVTGWPAYRHDHDSSVFRPQLARQHKDGSTRGVLAYALDHGRDLIAGGSLAALSIPSRPKDMSDARDGPTCLVCGVGLAPTRRYPTCSPKCSATNRQRASRARAAASRPKDMPDARDAVAEGVSQPRASAEGAPAPPTASHLRQQAIMAKACRR